MFYNMYNQVNLSCFMMSYRTELTIKNDMMIQVLVLLYDLYFRELNIFILYQKRNTLFI